jgi:DNA-binding transcriptional MocR family regulator
MLWESVLFDAELSATAKVVYAVLTRYAARYGHDSIFPGQEQLAQDVGCTRKTVGIALSHLEERGHIRREERGDGKSPLLILVAPGVGKNDPWGVSKNDAPPGQKLPTITRVENERESYSANGKKVPEAWKPTEGEHAWALTNGFTSAEVLEQTALFNDYREAYGKKYVSLAAAWRNWMRRSRQYAAKKAAGGYMSQADHNKGGQRDEHGKLKLVH